jgi:hypothetical protein
MQPSDKNIHKFFSIETLMHTNTSSKTTIYISRKHHTNMHAHDSLFIHCEAYPLFIIMMLTLSSLL